MNALAPHTSLIFEKVTQLECIKPYILVGGTALSLQLGTRQSEDLADIPSVGAMKIEVMLRRSNFRDYYDIYSIVKSGVDLRELVKKASDYSQHQLKSKNILAMLTNGKRFYRDAIFDQMQPMYDVTASDIEEYLRSLLNK